jgi:hypothetical protein
VVGKETKTAKKVVPMKKATDKDEKVSTPRKRITPKK